MACQKEGSQMPRVTVLIPTYNRPEFLVEALASLTAQTATSFEVIVLNDGGSIPPPVRFPGLALTTINLRHGGQSAALNFGLSLAKGTYVTVAQDDDLVLPDKISVLTQALDDAEMDTGAVYSLPKYTDENNEPLECSPKLRGYLHAHPTVTWGDVLEDGLFIHGTGTMYRRIVLQAIGGWDETLQTAEEYDLHLRLLKAGWTFQAVDAVTVTYRRHRGGKSQVIRRERKKMREGVMERIYAKVGLGPEIAVEAPNE
jgi:GT2 family glycosyltransferase